MARVNKTRYAILGLLHLHPMSGYDIKKYTDTSISYFWQENFGHIYPVLKKLEAEKLVSSAREASASGPQRIVYSISEKGRAVFRDWLKKSPDPDIYRSEILLKMFFTPHEEKESIKQHLRDEHARHQALLNDYDGIKVHLESQDCSPMNRIFWLCTVRNGILTSQAQQKWCLECLELLDSLSSGVSEDQ